MLVSRQAEDLSKQLARQDSRIQTLQALLEIAVRGHDVSLAAERIVRYCLFSSAGTTPQILSLSLDVLTAAPSHSFWVDALSVIVENLKRHGTSACLIVLKKIPSLPHTALQHLVLYTTSALIINISSDSSAAIRKAAVYAVATFVLRSRPLTASSSEAIRLEQLTEEQQGVVRRAVERLIHALLNAIFDPSDEVAVTALASLTQYAHEADSSRDSSVLNATRHATALAIWHVLTDNCKRIGERVGMFVNKDSGEGYTGDRRKARARKESIRALARLAAHALRGAASSQDIYSQSAETTVNVRNWAVGWVDSILSPACDEASVEMASCACSSLLLVCSYAVQNPTLEKVAGWGIRAVRRITRILQDHDNQMPLLVMTGMLRDASHGLAALSKNDYVNSKFVVSTAVGLLPFAAKCPGRGVRLEAFSVIASTVVEYDLSGRDAGVGVSLNAVLASDSWKKVMTSSKADSNVPSELTCCLSQSLLEASRKIFAVTDGSLRLSLTHTWAVMLSQLMTKTVQCLEWSYSPASSYTKELYLKLFDALGQYSAFLLRTQGIGMEEYERLQEVMVKATLDQHDVGTTASLLVCVTKYWLTSGMKAESHAGHMLKAIWKHAQEHYKDEEILLKELKTGALWSDAKQGFKSPAERAVEGGYISMTTAFTKRTKAVLDTVSTSVATVIENTLFGSIALSTAASEGSTLTTDFVYSGLSALLALVGQNPPLAERGITLLNRYISIMDQAESSDFIALEAVRNTVSALEMYRDEFFPKPVSPRDLANIMSRDALQIQTGRDDPLAWMRDITESCVFATSRLEDTAKGISTVATEEAILHVAVATKTKMSAFSRTTLQNSDRDDRDAVEGDQQSLNGASDPFGVVVSHSMDTVKGLALLRVEICNRSKFRVTNASMTYSAAGALAPLPDAATSYSLGTMSHGMSVTQQITLAVRSDQGYAGKVFFSLHTKREGSADGYSEEQSCVPYYVPSSDVLLLRRPAANAGVDVFRRRWDLMRHSLSFHVIVSKEQTVDGFVDMLERRSKCLRQVGRMRTYSHVCALVADSSRGDYVAVAGLAPEARGIAGMGPCVLYVTIRSNSEGYNDAFRDECREWLKPRFRVIFLDEDLSDEDRSLALRPQDAYFITDSGKNLTPYQRWRAAHSVRVTY